MPKKETWPKLKITVIKKIRFGYLMTKLAQWANSVKMLNIKRQKIIIPSKQSRFVIFVALSTIDFSLIKTLST